MVSFGIIRLCKRFYSEIFKSSLGKEIFISFFTRGLSIVTVVMLFPLSLKVLSPNEFGIWLTINALNAWVGLFDLGTQNTLRNKLTTSLTNQKYAITGLLLTNSFLFSFIIMCFVSIVSFILYLFIDFASVLNIHNYNSDEVNFLVFFSCLIFGLKLFTNSFNAILMAIQRTHLTFVISILANLIVLSSILVMRAFNLKLSLLQYGCLVLISDIVISILLPILYLRFIHFSYHLSAHRISYKYFKRHLFSHNLKFSAISFLIVISYFSNNFFIGIWLSYGEVTSYNLVGKYFNIVTMGSVVILNPIWTQVAIHFSKRERTRIETLLKRMYKIFILFAVVTVILIVFDSTFYYYFGGEKISIAKKVSVMAGIATLQLLFNNIHAYILNGLNKTKIQIYCLIFSVLAITPVYYILIKIFKLGVLSAFVSQIIIFLPLSIFLPFYLKKYIKLI